ncbi:uncharacterized protein LOC122275208 [Carya illinoinensis]|uniref:uncharacterized protein LOC122275208 n=1 Tax=Carya illinoinensis TaxID=32201 RepID=UPI001C727C94|nr:uncharacterized protein LOC122275208 [Carya illinoinensis]
MAAFGRPLPPAEFVPYLFTCLGLNYDALVSFVTTQLEPISPMELLGHLLAHEAHLLHHLDMCTFPMEAFANLTTNSSLTSIGRGPRSGQSSYMDAMVVVFNHIVVVLALQDCKLGKMLLHETTNDGLYSFSQLAPSPSAQTNLLSVPLWHSRLGHPSIKLITYILQQHNLPYQYTVTPFCNACA